MTDLARSAANFREGARKIYERSTPADMWFFELWHFLGDVEKALAPWQPIETAPQDGTFILATGGGLGDSVDIVSYSERVGAWNATNYTLDDRDDESQGYSRPKYWMALPPPPSFPRPQSGGRS